MKRAIISGFVFVLVFSYLGSVPQAGATEEQQPLWSYQTGGYVPSVAISSDGNYIAAVSEDDKIYLFSRASSTPLWSYQTGGDVSSVAISSDGSYIAAGGVYDKVYLFSRTSSTPLWSYTTGDEVFSVAISSDGSYIAAGSHDFKVYFFSRASSTPLWSYQTGDRVYSVDSVAISSDGSYIAAGSLDGKVYLFSSSSSTPLWSYQTGSYVWTVSISSDGSYIAAGSHDFKVYFFSRASSTPLWSYHAGGHVTSVSISSDGNYIATNGRAYNIHLFSSSDNTPLWSYQTGGYVTSVSISSDGSYIAAGSSPDNNIYLFSRTSSTPLWSYTTGGSVRSVAISSDGNYIAAGSWDDKVYLFSRKVITNMAIAPSSFRVPAGISTTLTATLTSGDSPVAGKTVTWSASAGSVSPASATTNSAGQATVTYTAPDTPLVDVTITASFAEDDDYLQSSGISSGTITIPTVLTITPPSFTSKLAENTALTATLTTTYGAPVENKTITWGASAGSISPSSTTTNSAGEVTVVYTAPDYPTVVTIIASFADDNEYGACSENSFCTAFRIIFTFYDPQGNPLANTKIYYGFSSDQVTNYLGTTDSQGRITSDNSELGDRTLYFKTSDGKYAGNTSIGSTGGETTAELTEVSEFPILWVVAAIVIVATAIGALLFIKKMKKS